MQYYYDKIKPNDITAQNFNITTQHCDGTVVYAYTVEKCDACYGKIEHSDGTVQCCCNIIKHGNVIVEHCDGTMEHMAQNKVLCWYNGGLSYYSALYWYENAPM